MKEIRIINEHLGSPRLILHHDLFTLKRSYVMDLCEKLIKEFPGIEWMCLVRLNTLDEELLDKMYEAGCREIFLGLESATDKMQKLINKKLDLSRFDTLIDFSKRTDMKMVFSVILGHPGEDEEDIYQLFYLFFVTKRECRNQIEFHFNTLIPMVGTPLFLEWRDKLMYDEYGINTTTDIPLGWAQIRDIIRLHPDIFSVYFRIDIGAQNRMKSSKFESLGTMIEDVFVDSITLAYEQMGARLLDILVKNVDQIPIPEPLITGAQKSLLLAESLRITIAEELVAYPMIWKAYETLARYETAVFDIRFVKVKDRFKIMELFCDPVELSLHFTNEKSLEQILKEVTFHENPVYYLVTWNEKENISKTLPILTDFATLLGGKKV